MLPESIKELNLTIDSAESAGIVERAAFPQSLQKSLKNLSITDKGQTALPSDKKLISLIPKLSDFSGLTNLRITFYLLINSSTLSCLPKTLLLLQLEKVDLENFGLPVGQSPENSCDWKEGAFSRLPRGLKDLYLRFSAKSSNLIDFKLFSNLPPQLASFFLDSNRTICENPKSFISSLPRRLFAIVYFYFKHSGDGVSKGDKQKLSMTLQLELQDATDEYYSDPFWNGHRLAYLTSRRKLRS